MRKIDIAILAVVIIGLTILVVGVWLGFESKLEEQTYWQTVGGIPEPFTKTVTVYPYAQSAIVIVAVAAVVFLIATVLSFFFSEYTKTQTE